MASSPETTINPAEAQHFGALAADWWNPKGSSAMLHKLNPVRLRYIRAAIDSHWGSDEREMRPLAGMRVLDVGCGAGLLCEPLARLGASVAGIDAAPENIDAARKHAAKQGLSIAYRATGVEELGSDDKYDLVTSMEVIEHVTDPELFVRSLASALAPEGLLILSTPNRTRFSRLAMIEFGEGLGIVPQGTHDWTKFLTPEQMNCLMTDAGLETFDIRGIGFDPRSGFVINDDLNLNYIFCARRKALME